MVVVVHPLVLVLVKVLIQRIELCRHHLEKLGHYTLIMLVVMELEVEHMHLVEVVVLEELELMDLHQEMVVLEYKLI